MTNTSSHLKNIKKLLPVFSVVLMSSSIIWLGKVYASPSVGQSLDNGLAVASTTVYSSDIKANKCKSRKIDWANLPPHVPMEPVHEKLLYVGAINQGGEQDPDMLLVIGADPNNPEEYGKLIHRMDLPNISDEVHHFGYNSTRTKIILPGLYSSRLHIVNLDDPKHPYVESIYNELVKDSKYTHPHTVIGLPNGNNMISMLGADTPSTAPGGLIEV
jgi:hypothetical protein